YIITLKDSVTDAQIEAAAKQITEQGGTITERYTSALKGFAVEMPDNGLHSLQAHEHVEDIEPEGEV
ncbi:hypothetical protein CAUPRSCDRAFT_2149, partial [Caulochytrium protostelioides]